MTNEDRTVAPFPQRDGAEQSGQLAALEAKMRGLLEWQVDQVAADLSEEIALVVGGVAALRLYRRTSIPDSIIDRQAERVVEALETLREKVGEEL